MKVTDQALAELEELWRKDNPGKEISKEKLHDLAQRILAAVRATYKNIPEDKIDQFEAIVNDLKSSI